MSTLVKDMWEICRSTLPAEASPDQVTAAERLFYAGATAMLGAVLQVSASDDTENVVQGLLALKTEVDAYGSPEGPLAPVGALESRQAAAPPSVPATAFDIAEPGGRFSVRDTEVEALLRRLAEVISAKLPPSYGFTLFLFEVSIENGKCFYISSAQRATMVPVIRAWLNRQVS